MIRAWDAAPEELRRPKPLPELCNTDGDPLLMTTDRYALEPGAREEVLRRLASLEGAVADDEPEGGEWLVQLEREGKRREEQSPELLEALRDFKAKHNEAWLDTETPALGGRTPRECASRPRMRARLDVLLKEMENHEGRLPEAERFDVARLREELGLAHPNRTPHGQRNKLS